MGFRRTLSALGLLSLLTVASCSPSNLGGPAAAPAPDETSVPDDAVIVDVRTPEEFAAGHLDGAVNIPVESPDFRSIVAGLDRAGTYAVYCRSGRRSAIAVDLMRAAGFRDVADLGSVEEASAATGLPVVG